MTTFKYLPALFILLAGCAQKELSRVEAESLLRKEYPRTVDLYVYTGDPSYIEKLRDAGLDTEGYVTVRKTKKYGEHMPWLTFTEKATPYLLETNAAGKERFVQRVKAAEEKFTEIIAITEREDGTSAEVTYQTKITNVTPFAKLIKLKTDIKIQKSYFVLSTEGWRLQKKKEK